VLDAVNRLALAGLRLRQLPFGWNRPVALHGADHWNAFEVIGGSVQSNVGLMRQARANELRPRDDGEYVRGIHQVLRAISRVVIGVETQFGLGTEVPLRFADYVPRQRDLVSNGTPDDDLRVAATLLIASHAEHLPHVVASARRDSRVVHSADHYIRPLNALTHLVGELGILAEAYCYPQFDSQFLARPESLAILGTKQRTIRMHDVVFWEGSNNTSELAGNYFLVVNAVSDQFDHVKAVAIKPGKKEYLDLPIAEIKFVRHTTNTFSELHRLAERWGDELAAVASHLPGTELQPDAASGLTLAPLLAPVV
jgi:hypothetical protein